MAVPLTNTGSQAAEGFPQGTSPGLCWVRILPTPLALHGTPGKSLNFSKTHFHLLKTQVVIMRDAGQHRLALTAAHLL